MPTRRGLDDGSNPIDEDTEGHMPWRRGLDDGSNPIGGDDVEGHMPFKRALDDGSDDDAEGHRRKFHG
jgi:hypothetical protein